MIKIPSYLDFLTKLVSFLGIDFNEEENKTDKCRIKELRDFNEQADTYNKHYAPEIIKMLSVNNEDNKQAITCFLDVIESLTRYLNDKNYYTIASNKRAMWGLFVFYYIPQFASMLSVLKNEYNIPKYLIDNDFMLPIFESNKIVLPTERLKKYLKEKIKDVDFLDDYLIELNKNTVPRHQTKSRIIAKIKDKYPDSIQEIESIINCTIFTGNIYQELSKFFKDNDKCAFMLVEYFRKCFNACNIFYGDIDIKNISYFEEFILFHNNLLCYESTYISTPFIEKNKILRNKCREDLFHFFNSYLRETKSSEIDSLENINTNNFRKGIFKYNPDYISQYHDTEHNEIISYLEKLNSVFSKSEKELDESLINNIFEKFKSHKYFKNYEHEFLYYEGLNFLAKNELPQAIERLKMVCEKCTKITAGKTNVRVSEILIFLRLLTENKIGYSHLNPEIKTIIDSQPEELILIVFPNPDEAERNKELYLEKVLKIIEKFNVDGYCHYNGIECKKYNLLQKMDEWITDFFEIFDNKEYSTETEEQKVERAVKKLIKGRNAKYPFKKPIIPLLQYTSLEAIHNPRILGIYDRSKISSTNMDRLFEYPAFVNLIAKTIENLIPNQPIKLDTMLSGYFFFDEKTT